MLVYVSYYTTSYTTTCGTFIDRFTVRKKKWGWFGLLFVSFFHLDNKISCFLFLFCVFIQTVVQPTRLSPGSRMSVHPLPELWDNPSHVSPSHGSRTPSCTAQRSLGLTHLRCSFHFIPPHSSSSSSSSSPSDRDVQGRIWR